MGITISQLLAASVVNEGDVLEIEQTDGVSRRITKTQLRSLLFSDPTYATNLPLVGDSISFGSADDFVVGAPSRWRTIPAGAYTALVPPGGFAVAFSGGVTVAGVMKKGTDYFETGLPVRVEIGVGTFYYGVVDGVLEFGITIAGATLPVDALNPILSLAVGTQDMVKCIDMIYPDVTYNASATLVLAKGCQHYWRGKPGCLVSYSCSHMNTAATVSVQLQFNGGANVSSTGVFPAAGGATTRGAFVASALGTLITANLDISDKQLITVKTPSILGSADYLIVNMVFVVP